MQYAIHRWTVHGTPYKVHYIVAHYLYTGVWHKTIRQEVAIRAMLNPKKNYEGV